MVKNKKGGRNHRKQASKHAKPTIQAKIRLAKDEDETYALVVKLNGNSMKKWYQNSAFVFNHQAAKLQQL